MAQNNPYIGPRTFQRNEGHLFFGREREARDLIALVASERLVVFYAQSGAGKSSIVNTRLIPNLETKDYEVLPVGRLSGDLTAGEGVDNIYIHNLIRSLEQHDTDDPQTFASLTLSDFLAHINYDDKGFFYDPTPMEADSASDPTDVARRALIIDQFEELFSTYPESWEKRENFFEQLAKAMEDDPQLWVVLVMREDYIAALDPYAHLVSNGMRVRYYMQRLGREAALKAVKSPVEGIRPYAEGVAEKLIDDLCSIKVQKPDGSLDVQPGQYAEPVQMQVVCYGLWDNLPTNGTQITEKDLQDVGDVNQSLGKYYDKRVGEVAKAKNVRERLIREWFEKKLITTGGIRNMVLQEHETKPGELHDDVIQALQSDLVRGEKRGGATWYELTHDRLVEPVLERNKIWFEENLSPLQRQAALWKDQDQNDSWLLTGDALNEVETWAKEHQDELTETENEFLVACRKAQKIIDEQQAAERQRLEMAQKIAEEQARSARRARVFNVIAVVLIVIAAFFAVSSYQSKLEADNAKKIADQKAMDAEQARNEARAGELSFTALDKAESQLNLAILLGLQADAVNPNPEKQTAPQKALLTLMQKSSRYIGTNLLKEEIIGGAQYAPSGVQYAPDGKTFAVLDKTGITFWNVDERKPSSSEPLNGHFGAVTALAVSKDGTLMASGGADGSIVIWDAITHQTLGEPIVKEHNGWVRGLAFSPDGKTLASESSNEKIVLLWDITVPKSPRKIERPLEADNNIYSIAFSPDGKTLAAGEGSGDIILWNVDKLERIGKPLKGHAGAVFGVAFTQDGKTLASGSYDDTVILWDVSKVSNPIKRAGPLTGHGIDIETIAVSPDGKLVASGDDRSQIILWDAKTGKRISDPPLRPTQENTSWVVSLAFSPDSKTLAAGYYTGGQVVLWDVENQKQFSDPIQAHKNSVWGVAFDQSGKTLITASDDSAIHYWDVSDVENPTKNSTVRGNPGQPTDIHYSQDGSLLATNGIDGNILFDALSATRLGYGDFLEQNSKFTAYSLSDNESGKLVIHIRNTASGKDSSIPIEGSNPHVSPDGNFIFYETKVRDAKQPTLKVWDVVNQRNLAVDLSGTYIGFNPQSKVLIYQTANEEDQPQIAFQSIEISTETTFIPSASFSGTIASQDGRILAFVSSDDEKSFLNVLDTSTAAPMFQKKEVSNGTTTIHGLSSNGAVLIYSSTDSANATIPTIRMINTTTGAIVGNPEPGNYYWHRESGQFMAYQYSNQYGESRIRMINTQTGSDVTSQKGSFLGMVDVEDGAILVYLDEKGVNIMDARNNINKLVGDPIKGNYLGISPDGKSLITSNNTGAILFWDLTKTWSLGAPLDEKSDSVSNAILSPDGGSLAWIGKDGVVLQDTAGGRKYGPFKDHTAGLPGSNYSVFSPNGDLLAVSNVNTNTTTLCDVNTQKVIGEIPGGNIAFNPSGNFLAIGNGNTNTTTLWDVKAQKVIGAEITGYAPALSPDGKRFIIGGWNSTILWDIKEQRTSAVIPGYVVFSPAGDVLAVGDSNTNTTTIWNANTQTPTDIKLPGTYSIVFSNDGKWLAVGNYNTKSTTLWDVNSKEIVTTDIPGFAPTFDLGDSLVAVVDSDASITALWDIKSEKLVASEIKGNSLAFSSNGDLLTIGDGTKIKLWDVKSQTMIATEIPGNNPVFSSDGKWLAIGDSSTTRLWDVNSQKLIDTEISGSNYVFSHDGKWLAIGSNDTTVAMLWDVNARKPIKTEIAGSGPTFSPNDDLLAIANYTDNITTLWDATTQKQIGAEIPGAGLTFSPDGNWLAVSDGNSNTTTPWDINNFKEKVESVEVPASGTNVVFSADGTMLADYHPSDGIMIRDLHAGKIITHLSAEEYTSKISRMAFYQGDTRIAAYTWDGTLITWDVASGSSSIPDKITPKIPTDNFIWGFSPDGNYVIYFDRKSLGIWDVTKNEQYIGVDESIAVSTNANIIAFSPDCKVMAYSDGKKIFLYDFPQLQKVGDFSPGISGIDSLLLVMDNTGVKYLITRDGFGNSQIWDWITQTKIGDPMSGYLQFIGSNTPDHTIFYIDPFGKLIKFNWNLDHKAWKGLLCPLAGRNFTKDEWKFYFPDEDYPTGDLLTCPDFPPGE